MFAGGRNKNTEVVRKIFSAGGVHGKLQTACSFGDFFKVPIAVPNLLEFGRVVIGEAEYCGSAVIALVMEDECVVNDFFVGVSGGTMPIHIADSGVARKSDRPRSRPAHFVGIVVKSVYAEVIIVGEVHGEHGRIFCHIVLVRHIDIAGRVNSGVPFHGAAVVIDHEYVIRGGVGILRVRLGEYKNGLAAFGTVKNLILNIPLLGTVPVNAVYSYRGILVPWDKTKKLAAVADYIFLGNIRNKGVIFKLAGGGADKPCAEVLFCDGIFGVAEIRRMRR